MPFSKTVSSNKTVSSSNIVPWDKGAPSSEPVSSTPAPSNKVVQFGRPEMNRWVRWWPVPFALAWITLAWVFGQGRNPLAYVLPLVTIANTYWTYRDLDRGARFTPGVVELRTAGHTERVPAAEITDVRVEKTPGAFSRSVYLVIQRGRFDAFDMLNVKAPDTPEGRARLQAKVDDALAVLHAHDVEGDDTTRA